MAAPPILGLAHVQIAIPAEGEARARAFYVDVLGFAEVPKPPRLAVRGGAWFRCGAHELHVGVETPFVPAKKAHPAFLLPSADGVRDLAARLEGRGHPVRWADEVPDVVRFHVDDPFGNRLEFTHR
jgi:catechol 2,3-dioxygenase-like lactoylglutathione lyase family enzyme